MHMLYTFYSLTTWRIIVPLKDTVLDTEFDLYTNP